jgi:hypothetical protein
MLAPMGAYRFGFFFYTPPGETVRKRRGEFDFEAKDDQEAVRFADREYQEQIDLCDYAMLTGPSGLVREW